MKNIYLIIALLFWNLNGFSISRVGNGRLASDIQGFSVAIPSYLSAIETLSNDSVRASGTVFPGTTPFLGLTLFTPMFIEIHPLEQNFPELNRLNRDEFVRTMVEQNYTKKMWNSNECFEVWLKSNATTHYAFVKWGPDNGYVILGPNTMQVLAAEEKIIQSTALINGNCKWLK